MSIATETTRIQNAKSALKTSIINKGVEVADTDLIDTYASKVDNLPSLTEDNALLEYANGVTGAEDTTLGDAVKTLADGYGKGGEDTLKGVIDCSVTEIDIPQGTANIADYKFQNCSLLTSVTIPNSVTSIGSSAFNGCSALQNITIEEGITSIGSYAFYNCKLLPSCNIPNSVTSIGSSAFNGCKNLESIKLPTSITSLPSNVFKNCENASGELIIPDNVKTVGSYTFSGCSKLTSLKIGDGVTSCGEGAFTDCSFEEIIIGNSLTSLFISFLGCSKVKKLVIGNAFAKITDEFASMVNLEYVDVGNSITNIGTSATTSHGFYNMSKLKTFICRATTPPTLVIAKMVGPNVENIYVPSASVDVYKSADVWSNLADKISAIQE